MIYSAMGIDIWEVIDAAKTKPFGFMPSYPGLGRWRALYPIDPFYLTWKAREYRQHTRFIELAGEINTRMPEARCATRSRIRLNTISRTRRGNNLLRSVRAGHQASP